MLDGDVVPAKDDGRYIKTLLDALEGELRVEVDAYLPLTLNRERVTTLTGDELVELVAQRRDSGTTVVE